VRTATLVLQRLRNNIIEQSRDRLARCATRQDSVEHFEHIVPERLRATRSGSSIRGDEKAPTPSLHLRISII
jgi:hypothetical protein